MAGKRSLMPPGEDALLARLLSKVPVCAGLGPGDDCAAVPGPARGEWLLLKTDAVAEDVHFLRSHDPAQVGWKALCRPLSDIAAMGGTPSEALVTFFSPPGLDASWWVRFYEGLGRAARRFGVTVAGGEMSRQTHGIAVSIALTGRVRRSHLATRSGGKPGDLLVVTGRLGGSPGGRHLTFVPRLEEGRWLARHARPHAMMDLSDGLGSDLPRLAAACGGGFEIDRPRIPRHRGCSIEQALSDGEDYELLLAVTPARWNSLANRWRGVFPNLPLTVIGRLTATPGLPADWPSGWDHFRTPDARGKS